jgi:hypothetical protein
VHPFPSQCTVLPHNSVYPLFMAVYIPSLCQRTSRPCISLHLFPMSVYIPSPFKKHLRYSYCCYEKSIFFQFTVFIEEK